MTKFLWHNLGEVAGPRLLEHMVDTVLFIEENNDSSYTTAGGSDGSGGSSYTAGTSQHRMLRTIKNRYGSSSEIGLFRMTAQGLADVTNPSEIFMSSQLITSG